MQYAVFAAYHLSLETSFLADEGASLPKMTPKRSFAIPKSTTTDSAISLIPSTDCHATASALARDEEPLDLKPEVVGLESSISLGTSNILPLFASTQDCRFVSAPSDAYHDNLESKMGLDSLDTSKFEDQKMLMMPPSDVKNVSRPELQDTIAQEERQLGEACKSTKLEGIDEDKVSSEYFSTADAHQSILVSFSSRCVVKGTVCERSRLLRIKFYGSFDKPLGRYLRDDLFDQVIHLQFSLMCCSILCISSSNINRLVVRHPTVGLVRS